MKNRKFEIGNWVEVKALVDFEYNDQDQRVAARKECSTFTAQVVGAKIKFLGKYNITIGILKEHNDKFNAKEIIERECGNQINVVVLPNTTSGPAATVYEIISKINVNLAKPLLIKDCDSFLRLLLSV